ncbi:MAG TPA: 50S ribosomal protein L3 N(5)-glutamine methyltransferase [Pseudomonadales bacterium]|nr:50S ribosomal protein L3 N(5)-glutamine methyltransferase [Pseudomonadales bacterium]
MTEPTLDVFSAVEQLSTIRDFLRWSISQFNAFGVYFGHGTDNPWDEALALIAHVTALPQDMDPRLLDARLTLAEREKIVSLVQRRVQDRVPLPYLTRVAWFGGFPFSVNPHVLIPRSPIAELIDRRFEPWLAEEPKRVLDLCTGSGCIGIATALVFPDAEVDLTDISEEALSVALENCERHGVEDRVIPLLSDLFSSLEHARYDLIVTNPPYVDAFDMSDLPPEYHHEPRLGLEAGNDGLDLVLVILAQAAEHLNEHGVLVCEVGNSMQALQNLFPNVAFAWPEFSRGGHGVFVMTRAQIVQHQAEFEAAVAARQV